MQSSKQPKKASLKRTLGEMEEGANAMKLPRLADGGAQGQRYASGQDMTAQPNFTFPTIPTSLSDDDDSSSFTSSDSISDLDDEDDSVLKPVLPVAANRGLSKTASVVTLSSALKTTKPRSLAEQFRAFSQRNSLMSASAPALGLLKCAEPSSPKKSFTSAGLFLCPRVASESLKPDDFLHDKMKKNGFLPKTLKCTEIDYFFLSVTEASVEGYDLDLVKKVREEDIDGLRQLLRSGKSMQVSNRFGDSIVHMACRRGSISVLEFLFNEAFVSAKVCCDGGRTPLHDACWTSTPNFGIVRLLLDHCPDLLYITDKRGFTPLNYARNSHWTQWTEFLAKYHTKKLAARQLWDTSNACEVV